MHTLATLQHISKSNIVTNNNLAIRKNNIALFVKARNIFISLKSWQTIETIRKIKVKKGAKLGKRNMQFHHCQKTITNFYWTKHHTNRKEKQNQSVIPLILFNRVIHLRVQGCAVWTQVRLSAFATWKNVILF